MPSPRPPPCGHVRLFGSLASPAVPTSAVSRRRIATMQARATALAPEAAKPIAAEAIPASFLNEAMPQTSEQDGVPTVTFELVYPKPESDVTTAGLARSCGTRSLSELRRCCDDVGDCFGVLLLLRARVRGGLSMRCRVGGISPGVGASPQRGRPAAIRESSAPT